MEILGKKASSTLPNCLLLAMQHLGASNKKETNMHITALFLLLKMSTLNNKAMRKTERFVAYLHAGRGENGDLASIVGSGQL